VSEQPVLADLPNLGPKLIRELESIHIASTEAFRSRGALRSAILLVDQGFDVCASKLYALEGAIRGVRWHDIPQEERRGLWDAFQDQRPSIGPSV